MWKDDIKYIGNSISSTYWVVATFQYFDNFNDDIKLIERTYLSKAIATGIKIDPVIAMATPG